MTKNKPPSFIVDRTQALDIWESASTFGNNYIYSVAGSKIPYNPEDYDLDQSFVESSRKSLFLDHSDGLFLYERYKTPQENGGMCFSKIANSEIYNSGVSKVEEAIFLQFHSVLQKYISKRKNHVELGPGLNLANKLKNIIYELFLKDRSVKNKKKHFEGIGIDVSGTVTEQCGKEFDDEQTPGMGFEGINKDWLTSNLMKRILDKTYYILGGSIGNYNDEAVVKILSQLTSDSTTIGRDIIIGHFLAPSGPDKAQKIQIIKDQYKTPEGEKFIMKGFESLGIDSQKLEFAVDYEYGEKGNPDAIKVGAKLLEDLTLDIGGGQMLTKRAGEYIWAIRSRRYKPEQFDALAEKAGCTKQESFTDENETMCVAVYRSKPKPLPRYTKYLGGIALGLVLVLGGMELQSLNDQRKIQKTKQEKIKDLFLTHSGYNADVPRELSRNEVEAQKMLYALEHRLSMDINDLNRKRIISIFYDRINLQPKYIDNGMRGGQGMVRGSDLYSPSLISRFIAEHPISLSDYGSIVPNEQLIHYSNALENSYFYTGPTVYFDEVDQVLPKYVSESISRSSDGVFDIWEYPCGIKIIDGKPYFVTKLGNKYTLDEKTSNLHQMGMSNGEIVADIIQQGEVPFLAEKICQFINIKYGAGATYTVNGQDKIAEYLTDLYARGYDLGYLLGGGSGENYYHNTEMIKLFVLGVMLPSIEDKLKTGQERMYEIDRKEIDTDMSICPNIQKTCVNLQTYLAKYIPASLDVPQPGKISSLIMKQVLLDRARTYVQNEQDMRCWLTEHREDFNVLPGLEIPEFPKWIDLENTKKHFDSQAKLANISLQDINIDGYVMQTFPSYIGLDGTHYIFGLYPKSSRNNQILIASKTNLVEGETLWKEYLDGRHGKVYLGDNMGITRGSVMPELKDRKSVIAALSKKNSVYSSANVSDAFVDYELWKQAMEEYQKKKLGRGRVSN